MHRESGVLDVTETSFMQCGQQRVFKFALSPFLGHSSGQQDSDQRHDDPPEESNQRIQNAQIKETDDDKESVRF